MEHLIPHLFLTSPQPVSALFTTLPSVLVVGGSDGIRKSPCRQGKNDCVKYESRACARLFFCTWTQSFCSAAVPDLSNTAHCLFLDGLAFSDVGLVCLVGRNPAQGEWNGVHQVVPRLSEVRIWLSAGIKQVAARSFHSIFVCATLTALITSEVFL